MGSSSAESLHLKTIYFGLSDLNSFSDARNTSISLDKTLVRVPNNSFRQNATLATISVFVSKKYVPSKRLGFTTPTWARFCSSLDSIGRTPLACFSFNLCFCMPPPLTSKYQIVLGEVSRTSAPHS